MIFLQFPIFWLEGFYFPFLIRFSVLLLFKSWSFQFYFFLFLILLVAFCCSYLIFIPFPFFVLLKRQSIKSFLLVFNLFFRFTLSIGLIIFYCRKDMKPPIPQNSSITYEVEILSVEEGPDLKSLTDEERVRYG